MGNCLKGQPPTNDSDFFLIGDDPRRVIPIPHESGPPPPYQAEDPILHPTPGVSRPVSQLTEDEQVKIAKRLGLISQLPICYFEEGKREKLAECIICMCEYEVGEELRYLPCLHTYHRVCIDDWLTRSFICPACLDEVDTALLAEEAANKRAANKAADTPPPSDQEELSISLAQGGEDEYRSIDAQDDSPLPVSDLNLEQVTTT